MINSKKIHLLSDHNRVSGASKCFRSVETGYFFDNGIVSYSLAEAEDTPPLALELEFKAMKSGVLLHMIGAQTDVFLTIAAGTVSFGDQI